MAKEPGKKPPPDPATEPQNLEEQIRLHAYELYEKRGREDGRDIEDWLKAEEEVKQKTIHVVAA